MRVGRPLILLLAVLATATPPAHAAIDTAAIAASLQRDPLYVDPAFDDLIGPAERRAVRKRLRAASDPIYVALVPLARGDRFDGSANRFLTALQARANRPGLYVAYADYLTTSTTDEAAADRARYAATVGSFEGEYDTPVADKLQTFLDALDDPDVQARADRATGAIGGGSSSSEDDDEDRDREGGGFPAWLAIVLGAAALAVLAGVLGRRRLAGPAPDAPPLLPERVFEYARQAQVAELRDRAREEVVGLSAAADTAAAPRQGPALDAYERALDTTAAASKLLDRATNSVELAAVLVLVDDGREALRAAADLAAGRRHKPAARLCFFDPLHGRAAKQGRWGERRVAACTACARDVKAGRDPEVLREDGTPWFERDGAIAATGMGHFAADLPARLARGDAP